MDKYEELREAVDNIELIDSHAHNIIPLDSNSNLFPFLKCFSEADGDALSSVPHSLSFKACFCPTVFFYIVLIVYYKIVTLYLLLQRSVRDIAELYDCEKSLDGVEKCRKALGLDSISSKCFKAAKISALLIDDGIEFENVCDLDWHKSFVPFVGRIEEDMKSGTVEKSTRRFEILDAADSLGSERLGSEERVADKAVAMKTIAAYRSGLEIDPCVSKKDAAEGLCDILKSGKPVRIQNKSFIDYIVLCSLDVALSFDLPLQIHTGFGDKDLDLRLCNPLHLRDLLEDKRYSRCRIVLLHASYPFSKEASFLASVYHQVYLDFGLAVPKLSVYGMVSSVKELLELAPIKKVMFSTDGIAFPETFYLGAKRARKAVFSVLRDACDEGDLTIPEALEAAEDIFNRNSIRLYKIDGTGSSSKDIIPHGPGTIERKLSQDDTVFVRIMWVDASGQHRCRAVPSKRFHDVVKKNGVGLTFASMGMSSSADAPADGTNLTGVGEIRIIPDLSTKWRIPWSQQEEMVLADMQVRPGEAWEYCPRDALRRVSKVLKDKFNLEMDVGFENEFYLLKNVSREGIEEWVPFDSTPYCSSSAFDSASSLLQEVSFALQALKISVEQFELALGHTVCNHAADNLIYTREVIRSVARKHGLLATFVPKYFMEDIGSGAHVHVSLLENGENVFMASGGSSRYGMSKVGEEFMAGVFSHLPSILAFIAPLPNSYDRLQPNTWSGAYHCWGKENREAPLRTACPPGISDGTVSNFEIKSFDGCANPHLGLASIIAAGIDGLQRHLSLPEPIDTNPYSLDGGIPRLPNELSESVEALEKDTVLKDFIGEKLVTAVVGVRKAEIAYYSKNKDAYKQLIHRY
ncbi:hypothetical protein IFM89_033303 [Coptis chinensis]|uniref:GS catalytic domain-containing protein n=1 Tax=Coptis chinensis TaxID=261450 RepID=A0A835LKH8_9MAGN|nr:hypothetical protein IFM89_033303 [Coptis chinensis]